MNMPHPSDDTIVDYTMGNLEDFDARALERHVAACVMCAEKLAEEARFETTLHAIAEQTAKVVSISEAPAPVWQVAPPRVVKKRAVSVLAVTLGGLAASVVLAGGALFALGVLPPKKAPPPVLAMNAPVATPSPLVPSPIVTPTPVTPPVAVTPPPAPVKAKPAKGAKAEVAEVRTAKKKDGMDDMFDAGSGKKTTLDRNDVLITVKANIGTIKACAKAWADAGNPVPSKLIAKWVIVPSGHTEAQEVQTPELRYTSCAACVVEAIKKWRFPEFESGTIPVTFPFPLSQ